MQLKWKLILIDTHLYEQCMYVYQKETSILIKREIVQFSLFLHKILIIARIYRSFHKRNPVYVQLYSFYTDQLSLNLSFVHIFEQCDTITIHCITTSLSLSLILFLLSFITINMIAIAYCHLYCFVIVIGIDSVIKIITYLLVNHYSYR